jgi:hypothetical protein
MQHLGRNNARSIAVLAAGVALMLGACSMDRVSEYIPKTSDLGFSKIELNPYSKESASVAPTFRPGPVAASDYVNADGSCAGSVAADGEAGARVGGAVGLQMTECDAVNALGAPEHVDVGANERGERQVKLLYNRGDRAGLYVFTGGRLTEIQRVAEAVPQKPQKPQKPAPKRPATG